MLWSPIGIAYGSKKAVACELLTKAIDMKSGLWAGLALMLGGCFRFPVDPVCDVDDAHPVDGASVVFDPVVGMHVGRLTWVETMSDTELAVAVSFDGPAKKRIDCDGFVVPVKYDAQSSDGLIITSRSDELVVDAQHLLPLFSVGFVLDPAALVRGGVAPEQPDLFSQQPLTSLHLARTALGWTGGEVRAVTNQEQVTLGVVSFGGP